MINLTQTIFCPRPRSLKSLLTHHVFIRVLLRPSAAKNLSCSNPVLIRVYPRLSAANSSFCTHLPWRDLPPNHLNHPIHHNQTNLTPRRRKHPLKRLTLLLQQSPHNNHATFPSIMLINRQQISSGDNQINPAKHRPASGNRGNQVEDDSSQMHQQLLLHRSRCQCSAVQPHERTQRKKSQIKSDVTETKTAKFRPHPQTKFRSRYIDFSGCGKMTQFMND